MKVRMDPFVEQMKISWSFSNRYGMFPESLVIVEQISPERKSLTITLRSPPLYTNLPATSTESTWVACARYACKCK